MIRIKKVTSIILILSMIIGITGGVGLYVKAETMNTSETIYSLAIDEIPTIVESEDSRDNGSSLYLSSECRKASFKYIPSKDGVYRINISSNNYMFKVRLTIKNNDTGMTIFNRTGSWSDDICTNHVTLNAHETYILEYSLEDGINEEFIRSVSINLVDENIDEMFSIENGILKSFSGYSSNITIPEGVKEIEYRAYVQLGYANVDFITFPSTFEKLDGFSLGYNVNAQYYIVSNNNEIYKSFDGVIYSTDGNHLCAFPSSRYGDYAIPTNPLYIDEEAFAFSAITSLDLPDSLIEIGSCAFMNSNVREISFGSKLERIESFAFDDCSLLKNIEFPNSIKFIGFNAFDSCTGVTSVILPESLEKVEGSAFNSCRKLNTLTINCNINLPGDVFEWCPSLNNFIIGEECSRYSVQDGVLMENDEIYLYPSDKEGECVIPDNVKYFNSDAFINSQNLTSIKIPANFDGELPIVKSPKLEKFVVAKDNKKYFTNDGVLFSKNKYGQIYLNQYPIASERESYEVPATVEEISQNAFSSYNEAIRKLKTITISKDTFLPEYSVFGTSGSTGWWNHDSLVVQPTLTINGYDGSSAHTYYLNNGENEYLEWNSIGKIEKEYTISFDPNGGKVSTWDKEVKENGTYGTLPKPTRSGYYFNGWYTKASGGSKIVSSSKVQISNNTTLYAHWTKRKSIKSATISVSSGKYNGSAQKPKVTVKLNKTILTNGKDYKVSYSNNIKASAKAVVKISGIGKYKDSISKNFTINKCSMSSVYAKLKTTAYTYNGIYRKPSFTIYLPKNNSTGMLTMQKDKDYTYKYVDNKEVGTAYLILSGKGNYSGTKKLSFKINKKSQPVKITPASIEKSYSEVGTSYKFTIKDKKEFAKVSYSTSNKNVATVKNGKIVLNGTGSATISVKIASTKHYATTTKKIVVRVLKKQKISTKIKNGSKVKYSSTPVSLGAKVTTGDGKLTYKSLNKDIVDVDKKGNLVFKNATKLGKVTIEITANKSSGNSPAYTKTKKSITITTIKSTPVISCSTKQSKDLSIGSFNLGATVNQNVKLTYSVDNQDIATVDSNGVLTMKDWTDATSEKTVNIIIGSKSTKFYNASSKVKVKLVIVKAQKAKWFMNNVNFTQLPGGDFSHRGTQNFDVIGSNGDNNIFAPFDCKVVAMYTAEASGNTVIIESLKPVLYADGTINYMCMAFGHDNDISDLYIGKEIRQGEIFYQTGDYGPAKGVHSHVTCIQGTYQNDFWTIMDSVAQTCSSPNGISPTRALFLGKNTNIVNTMGLEFVREQ